MARRGLLYEREVGNPDVAVQIADSIRRNAHINDVWDGSMTLRDHHPYVTEWRRDCETIPIHRQLAVASKVGLQGTWLNTMGHLRSLSTVARSTLELYVGSLPQRRHFTIWMETKCNR